MADVTFEELDGFFSALLTAAESGDRDTYTGLFVPNGVIFIPHRPPVVGRDEIGRWFEGFQEAVVLVSDEYVQVQTDRVGEVAMVRSRSKGHYLIKATEEKLEYDQKYLDVLQNVDGNWFMVYHVASSSTFDPGLWDRNWENA